MGNITVAHLRKAGYCRRGAVEFCKRHGLDWRKMLTEGLPIPQAERIGDAMLNPLIKLARETPNGL